MMILSFFSNFNKLFGMYAVKNMSYVMIENLKFVCDLGWYRTKYMMIFK
jgi:hypothetical protein